LFFPFLVLLPGLFHGTNWFEMFFLRSCSHYADLR
jgi:hypothetical protein